MNLLPSGINDKLEYDDSDYQPAPHRNRDAQERAGQKIFCLFFIVLPETDDGLGGNQEADHLVSTQEDEGQDEPALESADQLSSMKGAGVGRDVDLVVLQEGADEEVRRAPTDEGGDRDGFRPQDLRGKPGGR